MSDINRDPFSHHLGNSISIVLCLPSMYFNGFSLKQQMPNKIVSYKIPIIDAAKSLKFSSFMVIHTFHMCIILTKKAMINFVLVQISGKVICFMCCFVILFRFTTFCKWIESVTQVRPWLFLWRPSIFIIPVLDHTQCYSVMPSSMVCLRQELSLKNMFVFFPNIVTIDSVFI